MQQSLRLRNLKSSCILAQFNSKLVGIMKQFIEFVTHHWLLCVAFVVVLFWLIIEELRTKVGGSARLAPKDAAALMNHEDTMVLDLRTKALFVTGHILGATNIPSADLKSHMDKIDSHKAKPIILVDTTDASLIAISNNLKKQGFTKLYILAGGLTAWKDAGLPLAKK